MDESGALWIPSPNYFPLRSGYSARWIIVHGTAGFTSAQDVGHYFQRADVSTHYTIGRDAVIVQSVREYDAAWGNGFVTGLPGVSGDGVHRDAWWSTEVNPNYLTISIEHVKPSRDNSDALTDVQQYASFRLIRHICERHDIPQRPADASGGITGHYSLDPLHRSFCPGPYPWQKLFDFLVQAI